MHRVYSGAVVLASQSVLFVITACDGTSYLRFNVNMPLLSY